VILGLAGLAAGCAPRGATDLAAAAAAARKQGDAPRACALIHQAWERPDLVDAARLDATRQLVQCAQKLGHLEAVAARLRRILERAPGDPAAHYGLALVELLGARGRLDTAIRHLEAARRSAPDLRELGHRQGMAELADDRFGAAAATLAETVRRHPTWAAPRLALARALAALGRGAEVRRVLAPLAECQPTAQEADRAAEVIADVGRLADPLPPEAQPLFRKAMDLLDREFSAAAAGVLRTARERFPSVATFALLSGLAQIRLSNYGAAIEELRVAARLNPADHAPELHLAEVLLELGRPVDALPHLERAVALNPASRSATLALGEALLALRRPEAVAILRRAAALSGRSPAALRALGRGLAEAGRFAEAARVVEDARRLAPADVATLVQLGALETQLYRRDRTPGQAEKHFARALAVLREALRLAPNDEAARTLLRELTGSDLLKKQRKRGR
jgi:tetratricopeptide (TPR) repeat protein